MEFSEEVKDHYFIKNDKGYLRGGQCEDCGDYSFPKRNICSECMSTTIMDYIFSGKGTIHASTVVRLAPSGFKAPYSLAYVDLDEGPRVFTQLTTCEVSKILPNTYVEMVVGPNRINENGNEVLGYKFNPLS
jgi:uncharacterized OB-fold protein